MNIALMSVSEIRTALMDKFGYTEEQVSNIKGKNNLALTLKTEIDRAEKIENSSFFSQVVEEPTKIADVALPKAETNSNTKPKIGTPEWEDYVLAQLTDNEADIKDGKKYPKAHGLRRIAQQLIGPIVESGPTMVNTYMDSNNGPSRATVMYEVKIRWDLDLPQWVDPNTFKEEVRTFREAADAWIGNTPAAFAIHPTATASSRAEGRVFRRILQLSTLVAEELQTNNQYVEKIEAQEQEEASKILPNQKTAIEQLCKRLGINTNKLVTSLYQDKYDVSVLTREEGGAVLKKVNSYQNNKEEIPADIKA